MIHREQDCISQIIKLFSAGFVCDKRQFLLFNGLAISALATSRLLSGCGASPGTKAVQTAVGPPASKLKAGEEYVFLEARDFADYGGWSLESSFITATGSEYLMAKGYPSPVAPACTSQLIKKAGTYSVFCRCKNWAPEFTPGRFKVVINGQQLPQEMGVFPEAQWVWQKAGELPLELGQAEVLLQDLTGNYGRCSSILLTTDPDYLPPGNLSAKSLQIPASRPTVTTHPYDLIVVGGGVAGTLAAISAARGGCRVALLHNRPVLGGNASDEVGVRPASVADYNAYARELGLIEETVREAVGLGNNINQGWQLSLKNLCNREENLEVFLNLQVTGVQMVSPSIIGSVQATSTDSGENFTFDSFLFADCTGDADLGVFAGADFSYGRDPRAMYEEPLAPVSADNYMLGCSLLYSLEQMPQPENFTAPPWAHYFDLSNLPHRSMPNPGPYWWIEHAGNFDIMVQSEEVRDELLKIVYGLWDFIKNRSSMVEQTRNFRLRVKPVMGKRESRRLLGDYIMTEGDIRRGTRFDDTVAFGGWPIDIHALNGIYDPGPPTLRLDKVTPYGIPFRSLYSRNISNLLFAGRNASVSHVALASTRIMGTCGTMGQAIGKAASLAVKYGVFPRRVRAEHMAEFQTLLRRDDVYLPDVTPGDADDIALSAKVSASSELSDNTQYLGPKNVTSGISRPAEKNINAWVSDPRQLLPQWIQFDFAQAQAVNFVQIAYDTNLYIPRPDVQRDPLTVSSYEVQVRVGGNWIVVTKIDGNYQRLRRHSFTKVTTDALRIMILQTNGSASARIFSVSIFCK
jgi:hypothetical protein